MAKDVTLMIRAQADNPHHAGSKRGDIVEVREGTRKYSDAELLPPADGGKVARIIVESCTLDQIKKIHKFTDSEFFGGDPFGAILRKRKWGFLLNDIPANVKQELNTIGVYTTSPAAIKAYIQRKYDGALADL